jgi:two-component system catabolic regulation response regulator CreB/two-component system response regulator ChvI
MGNQKSRRKRILLVDDEPDLCRIYQIVLQDAGYECTPYRDSVKAMQEFKPNYYDLILLDIKMPILNGFELCKKIREADKTVQIAFVTASEVYYEKAREKYYPELANINYIQKPIGNEELVCKYHDSCERCKLEKVSQSAAVGISPLYRQKWRDR